MRQRVLGIVLSAAAVGLVFASSLAGAPPKSPDETALATVNGDPVTVREVLATFSDRHSGHAKFLGGDVELRKFLKIVIDDRLLVQEAYELGLDRDPLVERVTANFVRDKVTKALIAEEIDRKAQPTKDDIQRVWESLTFVYQVRQITAPTKQEAEEIRAALLRGEDPEWFARNCSTSRSRLKGGSMIVSWGNFDPAWENAVFGLEAGDVSPVIPTDSGYEVVYVDQRIDTGRPELEKVSNDIQSTLQQRRLAERRRDYSNELWAKYHVKSVPLPPDAASIAALYRSAPETVVATWDGGGKITLAETFDAGELPQLAALAPDRVPAEVEKRVRITVNAPLVALDAADRKIAERPEFAKEIDEFREYNMEALLFRDHVMKDVAVTDEEVRAHYDANPQNFEAPPQRRVAQILLSTEAEAGTVAAALAGGAEFAVLAKEKSRDFMTAAQGGDLGWVTADKVPPAFAEVLKLEPGAVSKPLKDPAGWHLIKVLEVKGKATRSFDEVKESVRAQLLDSRKKQAREAWVEKLRAVSQIRIDDAAIKAFVASNQFDENAAPPQHAIQ